MHAMVVHLAPDIGDLDTLDDLDPGVVEAMRQYEDADTRSLLSALEHNANLTDLVRQAMELILRQRRFDRGALSILRRKPR